ncbi:response regulator [Mucilaginibacter sp. RS28]|uniref:Response regulator n=1 Tax=Mucilaginibacter straminoryzae TaxID=2932774 RepID=A0A9X2BBE1_9SPHI|nr:response regulator [Mucilaginibacter straminoryzae]MCJ8208083.1 response regulator [Mucilaginibacter straminoryzae]
MKATIAILEPHPQIRPLLSELLVNLEYRVLFHADRFEQFILMIDPENPPQVCILDTNPKDMNGFDYSRWIKANFPRSSTVIYSNDLCETVFHKFKSSNVADFYVDKSRGLDYLRRAIELATRVVLPISRNFDGDT